MIECVKLKYYFQTLTHRAFISQTFRLGNIAFSLSLSVSLCFSLSLSVSLHPPLSLPVSFCLTCFVCMSPFMSHYLYLSLSISQHTLFHYLFLLRVRSLQEIGHFQSLLFWVSKFKQKNTQDIRSICLQLFKIGLLVQIELTGRPPSKLVFFKVVLIFRFFKHILTRLVHVFHD